MYERFEDYLSGYAQSRMSPFSKNRQVVFDTIKDLRGARIGDIYNRYFGVNAKFRPLLTEGALNDMRAVSSELRQLAVMRD